MIEGLAHKYDLIAEGFAERTFANVKYDMKRRVMLASRWGIPLKPGDSVLELGCGDGYLAPLLAGQGYRYYGMDLAPKMVEIAKRRLHSAGLNGQFFVGSISDVQLPHGFDAIVSFMRHFFTYLDDPAGEIERLKPYVKKKILLDVNPRLHAGHFGAMETLRNAGFGAIDWQPFFVPQVWCLPDLALEGLKHCESVPLLRSLPLRWKFSCFVKGEVALPRSDAL